MGDGDGFCFFVGVFIGEVDGDGLGLVGKFSIIVLFLLVLVNIVMVFKVWWWWFGWWYFFLVFFFIWSMIY